MRDMNAVVGTHDVLFVTLDTLRFDVARDLWAAGRTPNVAAHLPPAGWEERHTPGSFTFAAHAAFFAGFLPTPARPGRHPRPFAVRFPGSETTAPETCAFDAPDIVSGFAARGYRTICVGGVGFFNNATPLGRVLPGLFQESVWEPAFGVTDPACFENQIAWVRDRLAGVPADERVFLFVNVAALHQPNGHYLAGETEDTLRTHAAALEYVDRHLPALFELMRRRADTFCVLCSDHGTAYGEDGYHGHRLSHPAVWTVPYAEFILPREGRP